MLIKNHSGLARATRKKWKIKHLICISFKHHKKVQPTASLSFFIAHARNCLRERDTLPCNTIKYKLPTRASTIISRYLNFTTRVPVPERRWIDLPSLSPASLASSRWATYRRHGFLPASRVWHARGPPSSSSSSSSSWYIFFFRSSRRSLPTGTVLRRPDGLYRVLCRSVNVFQSHSCGVSFPHAFVNDYSFVGVSYW